MSVRLWLARGYEQLLPLYRIGSPSCKTGRVRPLFAGYVFGRFNVTKRLPVLMIPGVFNIVNSGGVPIALDEKEVTSVRLIAASVVRHSD